MQIHLFFTGEVAMQIILMRHYKVSMKYAKFYDSDGFDDASYLYNERPVIDQPSEFLPPYKVYASPMPRARQTAGLAFDRPHTVLEGVQEVTMRSFMDTKLKLPTWFWELMARIQWRFGHVRPYERYEETMKRLDQALGFLEAQGEDAIVVMHGLAMRYMVKVLRRRGFKGPIILHAKNGACYRYEK